MSNNIYSVFTGTGSHIPTRKIRNEDFLSHEFYGKDGQRLSKSNQEIIDKFLEITTIAERRYTTDDMTTSDLAHIAAVEAIESANIDPEELDYIIVAHNFGDVYVGTIDVDMVPNLASRVKQKLGIKSPDCVAYDLPFGCPGWLQGVIQGNYFIKSGDAKKILVIGADILSRIYDPNDVDCMLYSDGAGAVIMEARESETPMGILAHKTRSDTLLYSQMLTMGASFKQTDENKNKLFLKMNGRRLYQYALEHVPQTVKDCLDKNHVPITEIKKVLIHQANGKMDDAILERLYSLYGIDEAPEYAMPMTISWLGNSSVATVPTLFDLILKNKLEPHKINAGDMLVFASVGAGMHINTVIYKMP